MRGYRLICAAILAAMVPATALADDPHDPAMRSAAARRRDHETIRRLNQRELAYVRERDARYHRENGHAGSDYAHDRAEYERKLAAWRRAVAACRAGDYSYCDR